MQEKEACELCGLDLPDHTIYIEQGEGKAYFCCDGCRDVFDMLNPSDQKAEATSKVSS